MKRAVGEREVVQVDSNEENLKIAEEREEEAYQKIKDAFGVDPVKIIIRPKGMKFLEVEIDTTIANSRNVLSVRGKKQWCILSMLLMLETSWGVDVEDEVTDSYRLEREMEQQIEIKEYQDIGMTGERRYSAQL